VKAKEIRVESGWCDYVFDKNYTLPNLKEVSAFIQVNNHLPNIPSASEVESDGIKLGDMSKRMMEKIEELTLYAIQLDEQISILKANNEKMQQEITSLKTR
jgi:hypothetical protein